MKPKGTTKKRPQTKKTGKGKGGKSGPQKKPVIALPTAWER